MAEPPYSPEFGRSWMNNESIRDEFRPRRESPMQGETTREVAKAERTALGKLPGGGKAVLRVSIPVKVGGYTGQRDQWEEFERDYTVALDGDNVVLHDSGAQGRKITFDINGLRAALAILEDYR